MGIFKFMSLYEIVPFQGNYFKVTTVTPLSPSPYLPRRKRLTALFFLSIS